MRWQGINTSAALESQLILQNKTKPNMNETRPKLEEQILSLYHEPVIGSGYANLYGEENMMRLVEKYQSLEKEDQDWMKTLLADYSLSSDLATSLVSVGVLHALGDRDGVDAAYSKARVRDDASSVIHHFDIGKSLAEHFLSDKA